MSESSESEFQQLCYYMGLALAVWQHVEHEHFRVFQIAVGISDFKTCSLIYHASESFELRRKMAGRVVRDRLKTKEQNREWNEIDKALKDGNDNRNKLAHYSIGIEVKVRDKADDVLGMLQFGSLRLQPSPFDAVSLLLGRSADKEGHSLSPEELRGYVRDFAALSDRLSYFQGTLLQERPPQQVNYAQALAPFLDPKFLSPQSQERFPPKDDPPSDQ